MYGGMLGPGALVGGHPGGDLNGGFKFECALVGGHGGGALNEIEKFGGGFGAGAAV